MLFDLIAGAARSAAQRMRGAHGARRTASSQFAASSNASTRTEVCPPAANPKGGPLTGAQRDFLRELDDLRGPDVFMLRTSIRRAVTLRELWHLRAEAFSLISLDHAQHEATLRLARLNRHFPTRSPRSAFGAFDNLATAATRERG